MAAYREGIRTVIIPADNRKDLEKIDPTVREGLQFLTVSEVGEVLAAALRPAAKDCRETAACMTEGTLPPQPADIRRVAEQVTVKEL